MFDYDLTDKQVLLVLAAEFVEAAKVLGIAGSPLYGKVVKAGDKGLWLENHRFPLCPIDQPKLYAAKGDPFCHAHVFVPEGAIVSLAAFPQTVTEFEDRPEIHKIGFQPD